MTFSGTGHLLRFAFFFNILTLVLKSGGSMFEINDPEKRDLNLSLSFGISAGKQQLDKIIFLCDSNNVSSVIASSI
jgi:hypothetical protein